MKNRIPQKCGVKFNAYNFVVVENIGDNHFFVNKNVVTVFDDMVTTIKKVQKMNIYMKQLVMNTQQPIYQMKKLFM